MFGTRLHPGLRGPVFFCSALLASWSLSAAQPLRADEASRTLLLAKAPLQAAGLRRIPLQIGSHRITVEVAADDASRAKGLMFREKLAPNHGMLFVFPEAAQLCFWMKNTPLPLTVAFIDTEGVIINLAHMQPLSLDPHCSIAPTQYALEMEQGWFSRHNVRPGSRIQGLPRVVREKTE